MLNEQLAREEPAVGPCRTQNRFLGENQRTSPADQDKTMIGSDLAEFLSHFEPELLLYTHSTAYPIRKSSVYHKGINRSYKTIESISIRVNRRINTNWALVRCLKFTTLVLSWYPGRRQPYTFHASPQICIVASPRFSQLRHTSMCHPSVFVTNGIATSNHRYDPHV